MYEEIIAPSANYADLIVNNDVIANLAIDVLTCFFKEELDKATDGKPHPRESTNEFSEDILSKVFQDATKA